MSDTRIDQPHSLIKFLEGEQKKGTLSFMNDIVYIAAYIESLERRIEQLERSGGKP